MKPVIAAVAVALATTAAPVTASAETTGSTYGEQATDVSVGFVVGEPTGLSGRLGFGHSALVAAGGFDLDRHSHIHLDYLLNLAYLRTSGRAVIPFYIGVGMFAKDHPEDIGPHGGARIPVGVQVDFDVPLQLYAELVPNVVVVEPDEIYPHQTLTLNGALGVRARF